MHQPSSKHETEVNPPCAGGGGGGGGGKKTGVLSAGAAFSADDVRTAERSRARKFLRPSHGAEEPSPDFESFSD